MKARSARLLTRLALISGLAVSMVAASLSVASPAQAQKIRPSFFGMHDSQTSNGLVPTVELGVIRLWDSGNSWRHIETAPGVFDWERTDRAIANARAVGLRPLLVLGQTPQFHAEDPLSPGAYGDGATSMPRMIDTWKRYVGEVAKRYGNRIDYQIWNEANVVNYWAGSVREMTKLTVTASKKITNVVGKKATVVAPAFPLRLDGQRKWYKKYWSQKSGGKSVAAYVDVVSVNPYPLPDRGPEASLPLIQYAKRVLPKSAKRKPMWNSEINYGLAHGGSGESHDISADKQAAFAARTLLLNAGSNIRRVYWYAWASNIGNTRLVEDDRVTLTRAGKAWQEVHGWIGGTKMKNCQRDRRGKSKGVYTCVAEQSRREMRRVYWKPSGQEVRIRTHRTTRKWVELNGDTHKRKGSFRIKVGQAPVMVTSRR